MLMRPYGVGSPSAANSSKRPCSNLDCRFARYLNAKCAGNAEPKSQYDQDCTECSGYETGPFSVNKAQENPKLAHSQVSLSPIQGLVGGTYEGGTPWQLLPRRYMHTL